MTGRVFAVNVTSRQGVVVAVTSTAYTDELEALVLDAVRSWLRSRHPAATGTQSELTVQVAA